VVLSKLLTEHRARFLSQEEMNPGMRLILSTNRHRVALSKSSQLTAIFRRMYKPQAAMVTPEAVIKALNQAKVKFILMGTHGIGGWRSEPRATQDVDVLIQKSHHRKAVAAIKKTFPDLTMQDLPAVTRFLDPADQKPVIDLMKPEDEFYKAALKSGVRVGKSHFVPNLEVAIASKYAAMISPNRSADKKALDEGDFISMVMENYEDINLHALFSFGEMVKENGGPEIQKLVEQAKCGDRLRF
jgi:hypothetical protein